MQKPQLIKGLNEIAHGYDALLCDAWGVIHNGVSLFPGVEEALTQFRQTAGPVFVLTNAPRVSSVIPRQLDRLGLSREAYDGVVTSGDATRAAILQLSEGCAFRLGPDKDDTLYDGLAVRFCPLEKADYIICTGLFDDTSETPDDYRDMLQEAAASDLPMVCANPDIVVRLGDRMIYCGGALAALYETLGGRVIYAGKPHAPIYNLAYERIKQIKPSIDKSRILVVGDGLGTDILGANNQNLDVVFIADGIASDKVRDGSGRLSAAALSSVFEENNVHALAAMEGLKW